MWYLKMIHGPIVLIEPAGRGGVGHYTSQLAEGLSTMGAVVHLHTSATWNLSPRPIYRVRRIYRRWGANPFNLVSAILNERREGAVVVHWQSATHPRRLRMVQWAWYPKGETRWVYTIHNVLPHEANPSDVSLYRHLYASADGLIFHAEASRRRFLECFPDLASYPYAIIPHGHFGFLAPWDGAMQPIGKRPPVVLFFGAIRPYKGLSDLLEAMAMVHERIPEARLLVVGRPHESWEPYAEQIHRLHLESTVTTRLGYIPEAEVPTVLAQTRLVCLPYRDIDQSGVLLLAMASGLPVVATRVGGVGEVMRDGETGLLVPPENPEALAASIEELIGDGERLQQMGARAREIAERDYAWEKIAVKTLEFYRKIGANVPAIHDGHS